VAPEIDYYQFEPLPKGAGHPPGQIFDAVKVFMQKLAERLAE